MVDIRPVRALDRLCASTATAGRAGHTAWSFIRRILPSRRKVRLEYTVLWRGCVAYGFGNRVNLGEQVIDEFRRFHDEHYGAFSTLLRADFDKARDQFLDGSVDLLHLAGLSTYEELWRHFESWMPKLSERSVVLVHNTNERGNSGTWRAWGGLCAKYPHFEFLRGRGLGVLAVGSQVPKVLADLCSLTDPPRIALVRGRFSAIGDRWERAFREKALAGELAQQIASSALDAERLRREARFWKSRAVEIQRARQQIVLRLDTARKDLYAANLRADLADQAVALAQGQTEIARAEWEHLIGETDDTRSRNWRITSPIRWMRVRSGNCADRSGEYYSSSGRL